MILSSCRALKEELLQRLQSQFQEDVVYDPGTLSIQRSVQTVKRPVPLAAFGVAPVEGKPKDFRLAVRVYRGFEDQVVPMVSESVKQESETDIVTGIEYTPYHTLEAGTKCAHYRLDGWGTLGAFVEDDDHYYILSNNHVIANSDDAHAGDLIFGLRPNRDELVIGHLDNWVPLNYFSANYVDAAIARFSDEIEHFVPWTYKGIGVMDPRPILDRYSVTNVTKLGITTGATRGRVSAYELDGVMINFGSVGNPILIKFDDQIELIGLRRRRPFSQPGDSGSLIMDEDTLRPYALLFAGGLDADGWDRTIANPINAVLSRLNVRFVS